MAVPRVILLDLDDTILDDSSGARPAWERACAVAANAHAGLSSNDLLAAIEQFRTWFWSDPDRHRQGRADLRAASRYIVQEALASLGFPDPDLATRIAETYRDIREAGIRPFPGALEALERLRTRGFLLGLITNGAASAQRAKIERFELGQFFDHVLIEGEFGVGKPDPRVYRAVLAELEADPTSAWMVGDNLVWDVAAPQQLGILGVWVDHAGLGPPRDAPTKPDRVIRKLAELPVLIERELA